MAVALVSAASSDTGATSQTSINLTVPSGALTGHLGILLTNAERGLLPSTPAGWSVIASGVDGTNQAWMLAWRAMLTADASTVLTSTVTTARRMVSSITLWSGADTTAAPQSAIGASAPTGSGNADSVCPNITPAVNDCMLLGVVASVKLATPFTHSFTPSGGWTEDAEDVTTSASSGNPVTYQAHKLLSGGSGAGQTGMTATATTTNYTTWPATLAIAPASTPAVAFSFNTVVTFGGQ